MSWPGEVQPPRPGETDLARILRAWTEPGPMPEFHRAWQDQLRREWPTLAAALDDATGGRRA